MKHVVPHFINRFFKGTATLGDLNHTSLVLIPKVKIVVSMIDFKPIVCVILCTNLFPRC